MEWLDVKDATNRCLSEYLTLPFGDIVRDLYTNDLSSAMGKVCVLVFMKGERNCTPEDIEMVRDGLKCLENKGCIS